MTQGFLTGRCLPRISLAVLVTAVLKVSINISMSMPSASRMLSAANFPPIIAWKASTTSGFQLLKVKFDPGVAEFLDPLQIYLEGHHDEFMVASNVGSRKLRVLVMFTLDR